MNRVPNLFDAESGDRITDIGMRGTRMRIPREVGITSDCKEDVVIPRRDENESSEMGERICAVYVEVVKHRGDPPRRPHRSLSCWYSDRYSAEKDEEDSFAQLDRAAEACHRGPHAKRLWSGCIFNISSCSRMKA